MKVTLSSLSEILAAQRRAGLSASSRKKAAAKPPVAATSPKNPAREK